MIKPSRPSHTFLHTQSKAPLYESKLQVLNDVISLLLNKSALWALTSPSKGCYDLAAFSSVSTKVEHCVKSLSICVAQLAEKGSRIVTEWLQGKKKKKYLIGSSG